jgi:hypothetical protein
MPGTSMDQHVREGLRRVMGSGFCLQYLSPTTSYYPSTKQKIGSSLTLNQTRKMATSNQVVVDIPSHLGISPKPDSPLVCDNLTFVKI